MKDSINILILSAGRRVELVQCFKKAAQKLNINSSIVTGDYSETAPANFFSDKAYKLPKISDSDYISSIVEICSKEKISLIVPTIDTELLLLAEQKQYIESSTNAKLAISDYEVIDICRDKIKTQYFMENNDFGVPKMISLDENFTNLQYPLFIKPKSGSSSINTFKVNNSDELLTYKSIINEPIIQQYIEGEEYTVDVFLDFDSNVISIVPRLRIATRSGEISKGRIEKDRQIIDNVKELVKALKPIGHITVQLMKTEDGIKYIEINPRFGGGAPMSIQAGADSCENYYRLLLGEKLEYHENYRENITFVRFDSSICLDDSLNVITLW